MHAWRWNGAAYESCDSLPITDRGFRYGMALFETVRIWRGRPLFLAAHLQRLREGCADRRFAIGDRALVALEDFLGGQKDGTGRIYVTAGDGALTAATFPAPRVFLLCEERPAPNAPPCSIGIFAEQHHAPFGGLKTANYWANADALHRGLDDGHQETLLFNENSELISAATANVFAVRDGRIFTPANACGARRGVTRDWVMQRKPVCECSLFIEDLRQADEIFLTNSWYGVRPCSLLEERPLSSQAVAGELAALFSHEIGA